MLGKFHIYGNDNFRFILFSLVLLAVCSILFFLYFIKIAHVEKNLVEIPSEKLLKNSLTLQFPNHCTFVPSKLNNQYVIGEATELEKNNNKYLATIDLETNELKKIQSTSRKSEFVSFIINFADDDFILYEEFDQQKFHSTYFIWEFKNKISKQIKYINNVQPIHFTQVTRDINDFYINLTTDGIYRTYKYDYIKNKFYSFEERNSSHPTVFKKDILLINIDNKKKSTTINQVKKKSKKIKVLRETKRKDEFYNGIFTNGENLIFSKFCDGKIYLFKNNGKRDKYIYSSDWIESIDYKNKYITFIGKKRNQDRIRPQYYIIDVEHKKIMFMKMVSFCSRIKVFCG